MEMESSPGADAKLSPPSFLPSAKSYSNSSNSSSSSSNAHITNTRSDPNNNNNNSSYPTTFVQADTASFRQVVQMLTGSSETLKQAQRANPTPSLKSAARKQQQQQGFKLYERRSSMKNGFKISPLSSGLGSNPYGLPPRKPEMVLSPSMLDFPSLVLSPVTPLMTDPFHKAPNSSSVGSGLGAGVDVKAEEEAIAAKGFYLHSPSPRESEPKLLPLFPVTSPKLSGSSSS